MWLSYRIDWLAVRQSFQWQCERKSPRTRAMAARRAIGVAVVLVVAAAIPAQSARPCRSLSGDVNADGRVDAADVMLAQRIASGDLAVPTKGQLACADVAPLAGRDGRVTAADVMLLLRLAMGDFP